MVEEVATLCVGVNGHVLLDTGEGAASSDCTEKITKLCGVERITEGEEIRKEGDLVLSEVIQ